MNSNIGKKDRVLRLIIAIFLFFIGYNYVTHLAYVFVLYFFAIILTITSMVARCPLYVLLGFSSKGYGLDKITRTDIEQAVKSHPLDTGVSDIKNITPIKISKKPAKKKNKQEKKQVVKKTTPKHSSGNAISNKTISNKLVSKKKSSSKTITPKITKTTKVTKTTKKKPVVKKIAAKIVNKKSTTKTTTTKKKKITKSKK